MTRRTAVIHECKPGDKTDDRPADEQKWCLYTSDGSRLLGRHPSKGKAENQERAIQVNKHASLRSRMIRLAYAKPELREHLLPLLKEGAPKIPKQAAWETFHFGPSDWDVLAKIVDGERLSRVEQVIAKTLTHWKYLDFDDEDPGHPWTLTGIGEKALRRPRPSVYDNAITASQKTASIPGWEQIDRGEYLDQIWDMYAKTYAKLGLSKGSKSELVSDYNIWEIARGPSGDPIAFVVSKGTGLGTKLGLAGSDGSTEGKSALKFYLGTAFRLPAHYAEVSHAVEQIVMKHTPPVVCAVTVPEVIKKPVEPSSDGIHYKRNLSGVGTVEKVLVGNPKGIDTTDPRNPSCPVEGESVRFAEGDDPCDLDSHLSCQIDLD